MIPPLSQSRQSKLACPLFYIETEINGKRQLPSDAARRGTALHRFLSEYVNHLVKSRKRKDLDRAAELMVGMKPDAAHLLGELVDEFEVNPEMVWATEQHIILDEEFRPMKAFPKEAAYEMTLDLVELPGPTIAKIIDYKSHFHAFDPAESFQARLYPLGLMMLNPQIEEVEFELRFVRWGKARSAKFTRDKIEGLKTEAQRWRSVQLSLHRQYDDGHKPPEDAAIAGAHCVYCPLLLKGCPLETANPATDPEGALRRAMYHRMAAKLHEQTLRAHCDAHGPIRVTDGIGNAYEAAWAISEQKKFSIDALPVLQDWDKQHKSDTLIPTLSISGLSSKLKAKKRADLADAMANFCSVTTKPKFKVGKATNGDLETDETEDN